VSGLRDAFLHQLMYVLGIGILSVRLCVTFVYCVETAKHRIIASSPQDRPKTSFRRGTDHPKIPRVSLPMNPLNGTGVPVFSEFQHLSHYVPEMVRDGAMGCIWPNRNP